MGEGGEECDSTSCLPKVPVGTYMYMYMLGRLGMWDSI